MKNKTTSIIFMIFLISLSFFNAISPIVDVSFAERRHLKQFGELEFIDFLSGDFIEAFDQAAVDQFIFRERFRSLKAQLEFVIFNKTDNNDIVVTDEGVFKLEYPLDEKSLNHLAEYISEIQKKHLSGSKVYISIIPDKSYYWDGDILKIDYQELEQRLMSQLTDMTYIDIKDTLSLEDYYLTDPHWKQEKLSGVLEQLALSMGFMIGSQEFEEKVYSPFYGAYYGQAALNTTPDTLTYLYNEDLLKAVVMNYEKPDASYLYDEEKLSEMDAYDVFLSGSAALITIENPEAGQNRELVIFRDSFTSSLAPMLVESYSKITLVDLRYMSKDLLEEYVDFEDKDVLFLYSSLVVNSSGILK